MSRKHQDTAPCRRFPELGELLLHRLLKQWMRAYTRNDKPVILAVTKFLAHLTNQQARLHQRHILVTRDPFALMRKAIDHECKGLTFAESVHLRLCDGDILGDAAARRHDGARRSAHDST